MHSFIISQNQDKNIFREISNLTGIELNSELITNNPDLITIYPEISTKTITPKPSIKIETIRKLPEALNSKPLRLSKRITMIWQAETMTMAAQQAFLKLLEEPGDHNVLFLITANHHALLPTIQSRCQIIVVQNNPDKTWEENETTIREIETLMQASLKEKLLLCDTYSKNREAASDWIKNILHTSRLMLIHAQTRIPLQDIQTFISLAQQAHKDITDNLNPKLALDHFVLSLPQKQ